jgi:hypothetical protein
LLTLQEVVVRRLVLFAVLGAGLTSGCTDQPAPVAPISVPTSPLLLVSPTTTDLRKQIDGLLTGSAHQAAVLALGKVQHDISYRRSTLYASSLVLAGIPLLEHRMKRIPQEKISLLFAFLCNLSTLYEAELARLRLLLGLPKINFCLVNPAAFKEGGAVAICSAGIECKVTPANKQVGFVSGEVVNGVTNYALSIIPLTDDLSPPGGPPAADPFGGPAGDPTEAFDAHDFFPKYADIAAQPAPVFSPSNPGTYEACNFDSGPKAPTFVLLALLRIFFQFADGTIHVLGQNPEIPRKSTGVLCDVEGDDELHPVGDIGFSKEGMRNALLALRNAGTRALRVFRPTTLYAKNSPIHGDILDELLGMANIAGTISLFVRVAAVEVTAPTEIQVGQTVTLGAAGKDKKGGTITRPLTPTWTASNGNATVSSSGVVTGVAPGQVTITATIEGVSASTNLTVTPACSPAGGGPSANVIFRGTFTDDVVGSPPCAPDIGTWSLTRNASGSSPAGTILVRSSLTGLSDKPVEFDQTASTGSSVGLRLSALVAGTPPSTGTYRVKWTSAVLTAAGSTADPLANVVVRNQNGDALAFVQYQQDGGLALGGPGGGNLMPGWTTGTAQHFEVELNLTARTARVRINGGTWSPTVSFPAAAGSTLAQVTMDVHTQAKIGLDDVTITFDPEATAPVIDGMFSLGEWGDPFRTFLVNLPGGGTTDAELYIRNDANTLYLAVRFRRSIVDPGNSASFEFDNDNSETLNHGDDGIILNPSVGFRDLVRSDVKPNEEPCPGCSFVDTDFGGTNDGAAAFANDGTFTLYEFSHPLNSGDAFDFSRSAGQTLGLFVSIRMIRATEGSPQFPGDFGDTDYPGVGQFLKYTVK